METCVWAIKQRKYSGATESNIRKVYQMLSQLASRLFSHAISQSVSQSVAGAKEILPVTFRPQAKRL
jgi:hypothetical protein